MAVFTTGTKNAGAAWDEAANSGLNDPGVKSLHATFPALSVETAKGMDLQPVHFDEASFRWAMNQDAMATEKFAEGIRAFAADTLKLEALIQAH